MAASERDWNWLLEVQVRQPSPNTLTCLPLGVEGLPLTSALVAGMLARVDLVEARALVDLQDSMEQGQLASLLLALLESPLEATKVEELVEGRELRGELRKEVLGLVGRLVEVPGLLGVAATALAWGPGLPTLGERQGRGVLVAWGEVLQQVVLQVGSALLCTAVLSRRGGGPREQGGLWLPCAPHPSGPGRR